MTTTTSKGSETRTKTGTGVLEIVAALRGTRIGMTGWAEVADAPVARLLPRLSRSG
jgi:hypothetical protein